MATLTQTHAPACRYSTRWLIRRDMAEVTVIAAASPDGWGEDDFLRCLRARNCVGMVAETGHWTTGFTVAGFVVYELCDDRLDVLTLATHPAHRRRGVGRMLLDRLFGKLYSHRRRAVTLAAPDDNLPAHLWLRACGFRCLSTSGRGTVYHFARVLDAKEGW